MFTSPTSIQFCKNPLEIPALESSTLRALLSSLTVFHVRSWTQRGSVAPLKQPICNSEQRNRIHWIEGERWYEWSQLWAIPFTLESGCTLLTRQSCHLFRFCCIHFKTDYHQYEWDWNDHISAIFVQDIKELSATKGDLLCLTNIIQTEKTKPKSSIYLDTSL